MAALMAVSRTEDRLALGQRERADGIIAPRGPFSGEEHCLPNLKLRRYSSILKTITFSFMAVITG